MNAPPSIANAARARIRDSAAEIARALKAVQGGRPGDAERDNRRRSAVIQRRTGVSAAEASNLAKRIGPEAIWGNTIDFVDVSFLERGMLASRAVCRIISQSGRAIGTGFLIS